VVQAAQNSTRDLEREVIQARSDLTAGGLHQGLLITSYACINPIKHLLALPGKPHSHIPSAVCRMVKVLGLHQNRDT